MAGGLVDSDRVRRREVLAETLAALDTVEQRRHYHEQAAANLERWRAEAAGRTIDEPRVQVIAGDWGAVTSALTRLHGVRFAVLNMANAHVPGGGYLEGAIAQEENLFRRTDCHFSLDDVHVDPGTGWYRPQMTRLLEGVDGVVYLDASRPRVCIRGEEVRTEADLGYRWLPDEEVFPFNELRAAAQDLRGGRSFDVADARRRIAAQLATLIRHGIGHAVLSAFGCGAFRNPAPAVAALYREELERRIDDLELVAFAIHAPGYGPDNLAPFVAELGRFHRNGSSSPTSGA